MSQIKNIKILALLFLIFSSYQQSVSQTLPVGTPVLEDYYHRMQLAGRIDPSWSFTVRPIFPVSALKSANPFRPDSINTDSGWLKWNGIKRFAGNRGVFQLLPVTWEQSSASHHPYSWNDGSMIPARGYQTRLSGGFYARYGPLSIQLRPEVVSAVNTDFDGFNTEHADIIWAYYYGGYLNVTDIPERFGDGVYSNANWGQSSIRLTFDPISIGLSNENLWWGPGKRNSLLMSNNAPGFKHVTLNTTRPVKTPVGSFEGQIVAGRLENSGYLPPEPNRVAFGRRLYRPKRNDSRYLSGVVFTYQPKWTPGLFLGMGRVFQMYEKDLNGSLGDYVPFLQPFQKVKTNEYLRDRDQLVSIFARYLLSESKAEFYVEFGRNDHNENLRDFLLEPEHSRAYIGGFSKLFELRGSDEYIQANLEVTQLSQAASSLLREAGAWYLHWQVRQGYTNKGQVMGAGIGPGSNLQSLNVSWHKELKSIGLQFERYVHNNDFYVTAFAHNRDFRKRWIDLSASGSATWDYKNLLINARLSVIRSLNYQYWLIDRPWEGIYFQSGHDVFNFQGQLGVTYRF